MNTKPRRIISTLLSAVMSLSSIPPVTAHGEDTTERYPYTFFAGSSAEGAITINSDNICINGDIATNGTIVSSDNNLNINGICKENACETIIRCFSRIDNAYFNTSDVLTYFEDYFLEQTTINVDKPIESNGSIGLTGNINISTGLKALDDIHLSGNVENSWDSAICSETGDIIIDTENVNLNGLVYAPQGEVNINAMNLNINNVIIIADTITITCPNLNANYSSYAGGLIGEESETDLRLNANGAYDPETNSINIYWYTTVPQGTFDIQMSDDNDTYYSVGTVENTDSFAYELAEEFERKYVKVTETTDDGRQCESFPFIIDYSDGEHKIGFVDNDSDGLPDSFELRIETDPDKEDTDEDGLTDYQEIFFTGTDPTVFDSEVPGISDSDADNDKDGINNTDEISYGTNPNKEDTDGDGLSDYDEIFTYHTDPLSADSDNDGVNDGSELKLGLDPNSDETYGVPDAEYISEQTITSDSPLFDAVNTYDNPYELSVDIITNGDAEEEIRINTSGYTNAVANDAITGSCFSINTTDKCEPENIRLQFNIKEDSIDNALGTYADCDELSGIKRFNVFRFYDNVNTLLPVETKLDIENNVVYTDTTEPGTYCIIDMEKWFDELDIEPVNKAPVPKKAPAKPDYEKHSFNGHDYAIIPLCNYSWSEAETYCESIGGHLATITSQEEQDFIMSIIDNKTSTLWLGASKVTGDWEWVTKEEWSYTNWSPIEPSTHIGENYLEMYLTERLEFSIGQWNNIALHNNDNTFYNAKECGILCEWDNETTETPEFFETLIATKWKTIRLNSKLNPYNNTDTDRDSLTDWEEVKTEFLIKNSDGTYDLPTFNQVFTMADIILNLQRFAGTPYQLKLDDLWKRKLLPVNSDPTLRDSDNDELNDNIEYAAGTLSLSIDTDDDCLNDGIEIRENFPRFLVNYDNDHFKDSDEYYNGTSPYQYNMDEGEIQYALLEGFVRGDFIDEPNLANLIGTIASQCIPVAADLRDASANITKGKWGWAALSAFSIIPYVGDGTKITAALGEFIAKHTDDAPVILRAVIEVGEKIPDVIKRLPSSAIIKIEKALKKGRPLTLKEYNSLKKIFAASGKNIDEIASGLIHYTDDYADYLKAMKKAGYSVSEVSEKIQKFKNLGLNQHAIDALISNPKSMEIGDDVLKLIGKTGDHQKLIAELVLENGDEFSKALLRTEHIDEYFQVIDIFGDEAAKYIVCGDICIQELKKISSTHPEIIKIIDSASDKEKAIFHLIEYGEDAVKDYIDVGADGIDMLLKNISKAPESISDVWKLKATIRGKIIERYLASTEYKTWFYIGDELNGFYPVIDFQKGNTIVSLKTLNPSASSYTPSKIIDTIDKYAESLGDFVLDNGTELCKTKILDIRVPKGQVSMIDIDEIKELANRRKIQITIGEI